jgi:hypothetical protein
MKTQFNLEVKNPCSEKFENFSKTQKGAFCNSCNKEVIDFTKMTSQEIITYFRKQKAETCGIFKTKQLTKYSENITPKNRWQFRTLIGITISIFSLFSFDKITAQEHKNNTEIHQKTSINKSETLKEQIVKGVITDEDGGLPGASILLEGTTIGTTTNFDGEFSFPIQLKKGDVLIVSYLGYKTERIIVNESELNLKLKYNLELKADSCNIMGKVATKQVFKTKRSFWKRLISKS